MRIWTIWIGLFLFLACKKSEPANAVPSQIVADSIVKPLDTAKKPVDSVKKPPVVVPVDTNKGRQINYLALGDSYTIGESVDRYQIFPNQLVTEVGKHGRIINPPTIIARTGWTTRNLLSAIKDSGINHKFDMVTLLIGVNNQYQGGSREQYRTEFKELLQIAIDYAKGNKDHVFVISIPDWGASPFGRQTGNQSSIAADIDAFNAINKTESAALGISYTEITVASRLAAEDETLIASDGLHPSGKMYLQWASKLAPLVVKSFK